MPDDLQHLPLERAELANPRRRRRGRGGPPPADPAAHARHLAAQLDAHTAAPTGEVAGFDTRRLIKLTIANLQAEELQAIPGLSVVSQEEQNVTVLFATTEALADFRRRLQRLVAGQTATRRDILYAVQAIDDITAEDRTGPALRAEGLPTTDGVRVDVELWPLELQSERETMIASFRSFCREREIEVLDSVNNQAIVLLRVECRRELVDQLLLLRDVRQVDLPPRYQLDFTLLRLPVSDIGSVPAPAANAPGLVVLDTGITTNHPVLGPAIGDAQGFAGDGGAAHDVAGHGTAVAGIALYGDVEQCAQSRSFVPTFRLFSGRVADSSDNESSELVENRIARAVTYFREHYGCKVFNLSFGDERRPYRGGHVDRLAATLDTLSRQHGILFVVSAGNFKGTDALPQDWRGEYPGYLLDDAARIIDPAPALNVLTVGSLAKHETSRMGVRFPKDPAYQPVARRDEPSPFSRTGPGHAKAIKPELVDYGGNFCVDARSRLDWPTAARDVGELTTNSEFATQGLFMLDSGTSYAAARVSNAVTEILRGYPHASPHLLRALVIAHAEQPEAALASLGNDESKALRVLGYGRPRLEASRYSSERRVTLFSEESLPEEQHHFYEIPLPDDFFGTPARRERQITVALAHCPPVRRTRIEYKQTSLTFRVVRAGSLAEVAQAYRRLRADETEPSIPESDFFPSPNMRAPATAQRATRIHRQINEGFRTRPYFVVVTNKRAPWSPPTTPEPYALVVVIEDRSANQVQLYTQISAQLRGRVRGRAQVTA